MRVKKHTNCLIWKKLNTTKPADMINNSRIISIVKENPLLYPDPKTQSSLKAAEELLRIKMMFLRKEKKKQVSCISMTEDKNSNKLWSISAVETRCTETHRNTQTCTDIRKAREGFYIIISRNKKKKKLNRNPRTTKQTYLSVSETTLQCTEENETKSTYD